MNTLRLRASTSGPGETASGTRAKRRRAPDKWAGRNGVGHPASGQVKWGYPLCCGIKCHPGGQIAVINESGSVDSSSFLFPACYACFRFELIKNDLLCEINANLCD